MHIHSPKTRGAVPHGAVAPDEGEIEVDVDNDPGNEDPGSQLDRDATAPLIDPDE